MRTQRREDIHVQYGASEGQCRGDKSIIFASLQG